MNGNSCITVFIVAGVKGLWLELAIVADHTMLKFHGRERVKHYILALMNIVSRNHEICKDTCIAISYKCSIITVNLCNTLKVSAIFNDHSLESNMTLVINKLFLYEEKDLVIKYGNVKKSLEAVNKWNYRHLMKLPPGMTSYQ